MPRDVVLSPYNPRWATQFKTAAAQLQTVLGNEAVAIHHIGSTAIPGIKAKPIIDILIEVRDIEQVDGFNVALAQLSYRARGENGAPGRRYFTLGDGDQRSQHIHMFQKGHLEIARHLNFRDYLRAHPQAARVYEAMKIQKAQQFAHDGAQYTEAKTNLVHQIDARATAWKED